MSSVPPPRQVKTVVHRPSASSARRARSAALAYRPPFAELSSVFLVLLVFSALGTLFAVITAADFNILLVIIVLLLALPALASYYALYIILDHLAKQQ